MLKQISYSINFQFCLMINKRSIFLIGTYYMWKRQYNFVYYLHLHLNTYTFKEHVCIWIRVYMCFFRWAFIIFCFKMHHACIHFFLCSMFQEDARTFLFLLYESEVNLISSTNLCHLSLYMTWIGRKACHKKLSSKEEEKGLC